MQTRRKRRALWIPQMLTIVPPQSLIPRSVRLSQFPQDRSYFENGNKICMQVTLFNIEANALPIRPHK